MQMTLPLPVVSGSPPAAAGAAAGAFGVGVERATSASFCDDSATAVMSISMSSWIDTTSTTPTCTCDPAASLTVRPVPACFFVGLAAPRAFLARSAGGLSGGSPGRSDAGNRGVVLEALRRIRGEAAVEHVAAVDRLHRLG